MHTVNMKLGPSFPEQIVVFDTETTGVDTEHDRIVTAFIGVMDTDTGEVVERWSWMIDPGIPIPEGAAAVHGITTERAQAEGMDPKQAVFEISQRLDILERRSLVLVAMNAVFDFTILDRELLRHWPDMRPLMEPNAEGKVVRPVVFDPMVFDRAVDKYRAGGRKLIDLCAKYDVPVEANAHDAEADCRMAGRVAIRLLGHSKLQGLSLSEVHAALIVTFRNQKRDLAAFWSQGKGLAGKSPVERQTAIQETLADANGWNWPLRPRPTEGATA